MTYSYNLWVQKDKLPPANSCLFLLQGTLNYDVKFYIKMINYKQLKTVIYGCS
jgi:hypothetical protein